jgi:hypothetical protein
MQMYIQCGDLQELVAVVAGLVEKGVTFRADTARLIVELTGGY